jgi:site-specific DNA-methyltransferase (adenine-specific)
MRIETIGDATYSEHVHASGKRGASGWKGEISVERDLGFAAINGEQIEVLASYCARAARWSMVFSDTESSHIWRGAMEGYGLQYVRTAFWRKTGGAPQFTGDRPAVAVESITICHPKGKKHWNGGGKHGFYDVPIVLDRAGPNSEARVHTTQKPLALMAALVADFTDAGETIADAFMGSGTTGVAAIQQGRKFVGIERDPHYFEVACDRISNALRQASLFEAATPKAEQTNLFGEAA